MPYHNGAMWYPFDIEYQTDEGKFRVILFATSRLHAELMLEDLKRTAVVGGEHVVN